jgi:hypothetical protein
MSIHGIREVIDFQRYYTSVTGDTLRVNRQITQRVLFCGPYRLKNSLVYFAFLSHAQMERIPLRRIPAILGDSICYPSPPFHFPLALLR